MQDLNSEPIQAFIWFQFLNMSLLAQDLLKIFFKHFLILYLNKSFKNLSQHETGNSSVLEQNKVYHTSQGSNTTRGSNFTPGDITPY